MKNWDELRTAYEVAKSGTVTAAAEALNIHRATVIRHIDSLEAELGTKLFQRHGRGYTPTDMGNDLLQVAGLAESEFSQLKARTKGITNCTASLLLPQRLNAAFLILS